MFRVIAGNGCVASGHRRVEVGNFRKNQYTGGQQLPTRTSDPGAPMAKIEIQQWDPQFAHTSPIFDDVAALLGERRYANWPSCEQLNSLLPAAAANEMQQPIRFVPQETPMDELYYEEWIYLKAQCPHRIASWHDFFNAMIWCLFPSLKRIMNFQHYQDIELAGRRQRTARRDALTMFDECGVVVPSCDPQLIDALQNHHWKEAFVQQRSAWGERIDAFMVGHANYEKALAPYLGFTGKALYLPVEAAFFEWSRVEQYRYLDRRLTELLSQDNLLRDNKALTPLPILGVPGWYDANRDPSFYDNQQYFRPKRRMGRPA